MSASEVMDAEPVPPWDEERALAPVHPQHPHAVQRRSVSDVINAMEDLKLIRTFIANELVEGINADYGTIPGTKKKVLLLPGAQKIDGFFNVRPTYEVERAELGGGHVEYIVTAHLVNRASGEEVSSGVGSCTTMETKYRFRSGDPIDTGTPVPKAYWESRDPELLGGKRFTTVKVDGAWHIAEKVEQIENPNIYDLRNTVLKMAKKRAYVDATISLGALSELFTQDLEDVFDIATPESKPSGAGAPGSTSSRPGPIERDEAPATQTRPSGPSSAPASDDVIRITAPIQEMVLTTKGDETWVIKGGSNKGAVCAKAKVRGSIFMVVGQANVTLAQRFAGSGRDLLLVGRNEGGYRNIYNVEEV